MKKKNVANADTPRKVTATLLVEVETEFCDDESSAETVRYCVEQDLEDVGYNLLDVTVFDRLSSNTCIRKFDHYIKDFTRKPTDENIALYEQWVECMGEIQDILSRPEIKKSCLSCSNSFSEEGSSSGDILHCMEKEGKIVKEDNC